MITLEQVQHTIGLELPPIRYTYTERDVSLYALGVGAPADWLSQSELKFVYELSGEGFQVLPSFATIYLSGFIHSLLAGKIGEIEYNPMMIVHGEQFVQIKKSLPTAAIITSQPIINAIYDKGSGLMMIVDVMCRDENEIEVAFLQSAMFIRGLGGFGGERGESHSIEIPTQEPDQTVVETTLAQQALIYRLSGDTNPLHADPNMAAIGGFSTPILHGLSTFGFATRAIIKSFGNNEANSIDSLRVRFSKPVFPGETLQTDMWQITDHEIVFQTKIVERDQIVLTNAKATLTK